MATTTWVILGVIAVLGAIGSLVSSFVGDSGWHLPMQDEGVFRPGWIGNALVGAAAALASFGMMKGAVLVGTGAAPLSLSTAEASNALLLGFGGASWFKSQLERSILQKTAALAAQGQPDPVASTVIATATPMDALKTARALVRRDPGGQNG